MKFDHAGFAQEWVQAWNSHDLERILAHYEEDVTLVSPVAREIFGAERGMVRGKPELRRYFARGLERLPNLTFRLQRVYSGVDSVVVEYSRDDGRHAAEFMAFANSGRVVQVVAHYASE